MYAANLAKFQQNEDLRAALLSTGTGAVVAYGFPFWVKWNGVLLERIREELRPEADVDGGDGLVARDDGVLQARVAAMEQYKAQYGVVAGSTTGGT